MSVLHMVSLSLICFCGANRVVDFQVFSHDSSRVSISNAGPVGQRYVSCSTEISAMTTRDALC